MSFGLSTQLACFLPVVGDIVNYHVNQSLQKDLKQRASDAPDILTVKVNHRAILKETNKFHIIGIIRNLLTVATIIAGIATGILPLELIGFAVVAGVMAIKRAYCIYQNSQVDKNILSDNNGWAYIAHVHFMVL